ncbi:MAG: hypothetical protein O3A51_01025 [Verrucomicrobia bacterium]|nr:hypothetical protein [Verrucomicrobiota bacterium]
MNDRDRILGMIRGELVDTLPFRDAYGLMPGVLESWHQEGLPRTIDDSAVNRYFGLPDPPPRLPLDFGFRPRFEERIIEETAEHRITLDRMGRRSKLLKGVATLPLPLDFPVSDWRTWRDYKRRLEFSVDRVGVNLERTAAENRARGALNRVGMMGFYWFPRDLMGDEGLCMAYFEQPDLVTDICDTWCTLIEHVLGAALEHVQIDCIHFGEDMAYRNGPMVGPNIFDGFIAPYYERINQLRTRHRVPIFSVDTDGRIDMLAKWFQRVGVNLIGPCEVQAGNELLSLRQELGNDMILEGGLDKRVLLEGPRAITSMLARVVPPMKSSGKWIASLDHRVLAGTTLNSYTVYVNTLRDLMRYQVEETAWQ